MSDSSKQDRDRMLLLISELMETRMQSAEALLQLQSTMKEIQQLRAGSWLVRHTDRLNQQSR